MAQNASDQSHCEIFKTLVWQDKLWIWFSTCDYTFLDPTNHFNHFAFVSSGKHWFPDDSNHVINGDHNDDNSDNYVDYNDENDVNFMVIMIAMVATVMIMKTTMIKIIMVMIIVIMMMVKH